MQEYVPPTLRSTTQYQVTHGCRTLFTEFLLFLEFFVQLPLGCILQDEVHPTTVIEITVQPEDVGMPVWRWWTTDITMYMIAVYNLTSGTTHTHSTEWDGKWKWEGGEGHTYAICWTVMCHLVSTWSCGRPEGQVPDLVPRLEGLLRRFVGWLSAIH